MYIGNDLQIAHPSYKIIDDISSSFNGSTTSFALQVNGQTPVPFPISTQQVMISVNGVVQEPDPSGSAGFKLLGSNIVFSSAPANGHAFFGVINAGADYVTAGSEFPDGSVTAPSFTFQDDQDTGWYRISSGSVGYSANGVQILDFDGNGLNIPDNKKLQIGSGTDLQLYHDGSHSYIAETGTGRLHINTSQLRVNNAADNEILISATENGSVELYNNNTKRFETTAGGTIVTGTLDTTDTISSGNSNIKTNGDTGKFLAGASNDLQIYHDGNNSSIKNDTGTLHVAGDLVKLTSSNFGSIYLQGTLSGSVDLYHNNSKKLETTAAGVTVTGTVSDSKGDLRKIIQNTQSSAYTLVAADAGKHILASGNITIPNSVFSAGDGVVIVNNTSGDLTITSGITNLYLGTDGSTGNKTLASRCTCTVLFTSGTAGYISGGGLS